MSNNLITVASFGNLLEAEIARGKLRSVGIESYIFKDDCGGMRPHMALTAGIQLKVSEQKRSEAETILSTEAEDSEPIEDSFEDSFKKAQLLLNRSRGWILVGFAIIPAWISFPISYVYATKAFNYSRISQIDDSDLNNAIYRIRIISALFSILFWAIAFLYAVEHFTNR